MGGPGSGHRWRSSSSTCEAYKRIDLRFLRKKNWLKPGQQYGLSWSYGDEPSGSIKYWAYANYLKLEYRSKNHGDDQWQDVEQQVPFDFTALYLGGQRQWFRCPRCNRRCLVLYGGSRFYCRKCYRLKYQTQSEDAWQRQMTKAQKIRKRLGGNESIDELFPLKPKGMHWMTYHRLEAIDERANQLWQVMVTKFMSKL